MCLKYSFIKKFISFDSTPYFKKHLLEDSKEVSLNSSIDFTPYKMKINGSINKALYNERYPKNKCQYETTHRSFNLFPNCSSFNSLHILLMKMLFNVIIILVTTSFQFGCTYDRVHRSPWCTDLQGYGFLGTKLF